MFDNAMLLLLLPFVVMVLIIAWLVYATMGGRAIKLVVKGLGIEINIDTTGHTHRRKTD